MRSLQKTNPYLRRASTRNKMTKHSVRDSCAMEGLILPHRHSKKKHNHKSAR